eukprot:gene11284-biopygen2138
MRFFPSTAFGRAEMRGSWSQDVVMMSGGTFPLDLFRGSAAAPRGRGAARGVACPGARRRRPARRGGPPPAGRVAARVSPASPRHQGGESRGIALCARTNSHTDSDESLNGQLGTSWRPLTQESYEDLPQQAFLTPTWRCVVVVYGVGEVGPEDAEADVQHLPEVGRVEVLRHARVRRALYHRGEVVGDRDRRRVVGAARGRQDLLAAEIAEAAGRVRECGGGRGDETTVTDTVPTIATGGRQRNAPARGAAEAVVVVRPQLEGELPRRPPLHLRDAVGDRGARLRGPRRPRLARRLRLLDVRARAVAAVAQRGVAEHAGQPQARVAVERVVLPGR